jgi:uncharacterized protein YdeI (YjbR/CyaY-like superfamily)
MSNEDALPADIQAALSRDRDVGQIFDRLAPSHRREYLRWVLDAKKPETRARRSKAWWGGSPRPDEAEICLAIVK